MLLDARYALMGRLQHVRNARPGTSTKETTAMVIGHIQDISDTKTVSHFHSENKS